MPRLDFDRPVSNAGTDSEITEVNRLIDGGFADEGLAALEDQL